MNTKQQVLQQAKNYGYDNISDYYDFILDNRINGNLKDAKQLFNALPLEAKKEFLLDVCVNREYLNWFITALE